MKSPSEILWGILHFIDEYSPIIFGIVIGSVAHYGQKLVDGEVITLPATIGFVMQLGMIGLVAQVATTELGIVNSDLRAFSAAVLALSAKEVIQAAKKRGWIGTFNASLPGDDK